MAVTVGCTKITGGATPTDPITILFDDGVELSFNDLQHLKDSVSVSPITAEMTRIAMLGYWITTAPDASRRNLIEGKTMTIDQGTLVAAVQVPIP